MPAGAAGAMSGGQRGRLTLLFWTGGSLGCGIRIGRMLATDSEVGETVSALVGRPLYGREARPSRPAAVGTWVSGLSSEQHGCVTKCRCPCPRQLARLVELLSLYMTGSLPLLCCLVALGHPSLCLPAHWVAWDKAVWQCRMPSRQQPKAGGQWVRGKETAQGTGEISRGGSRRPRCAQPPAASPVAQGEDRPAAPGHLSWGAAVPGSAPCPGPRL